MFNYNCLTSNEVRLLLSCCRDLVGNISQAQLQEALEQSYNEELFLTLAAEQRLLILLHKVLVQSYQEVFSPRLTNVIEQQARNLILPQLQLTKVMIDVHKKFSQQNIAHIYLKGPLLNHILFGEELLRYSNDLDVLVSTKDILKADACLKRLGFSTQTSRWKQWLYSKFHLLSARKDIAYVKPGFPYRIELHWKTCFIENLINHKNFNWQTEVINYPFHNEALPILSEYYNCLYLCLHAAKHNWSRLRWLLDVALFMQRKRIDGKKLLALAKTHHLEQVVQEAFMLIDQLLEIKDYQDCLPVDQKQHTKFENRLLKRFYLVGQTKLSAKQKLVALYYRGFIYTKIRHRARLRLAAISDAIINRLP